MDNNNYTNNGFVNGNEGNNTNSTNEVNTANDVNSVTEQNNYYSQSEETYAQSVGAYQQNGGYQQSNGYQQAAGYQQSSSGQQGNGYQQSNPYQQTNGYQQNGSHQQANGYQQSNPYQQANAFQQGGSAQQGNGYQQSNPYQQAMYRQSMPKPSKKKKTSSGFGVKLGKCAAIALVFGLVAGSAFTGVNYVGNRVLGVSKGNSSASESAAVESSANIQPTATGYAKELVDVSAIVEEVMPSIVAITNTATVTYQSFWGQMYTQPSESCGSGIIIDKNDQYLYIASNNHVVSDADTLTVQFSDGSTAEAEVRGTVPGNDLAVVQIKLEDIKEKTMSAIKVATIGDTDSLQVGEASIAIGNALGYGQSVTTGVISALGRSVTTQDETTGQTITNSKLIQTDAAINPGNSGGALLNAKGEVIGINSVKYASTEVEGIGYAIPMGTAMPIIQSLIENGDYVNTQSAYLGIQGQDLTSDVAKVYNMPEGIYIAKVIAGSGAQKAGLQQGDIITKFGDVSVTSMSELQAELAGYSAGDKVTVIISRQQGHGYEEMEVEVTLSSAKDLKE